MNSGVVPHTAVCFVLILTEYLECEWEKKKWQEKSDLLVMVLMGSCTLFVLFLD